MTSTQATVTPQSRRFLPWLLLLFIGSGCAALMYEIIWFQLLQLIIGLTSVSLGFLLGSFMGGMCIGSLLLPRMVSPRIHPLKVYAWLELGIAVFGIAIVWIVPTWVSHVYTRSVGSGISSMMLRGVVAAVCLLPPTILMGATLPAIARWMQSTKDGVSWLGFLYFGNIAGAVVSCLLTGFYLLRFHDMPYATYVAAALNVVVALIGFGIAAKTESSAPVVNDVSDVGVSPVEGSKVALLAIGLSGMAALGAEVVWTRLLSLSLGQTVYTFSIILAVFLGGLGLGSGAGSFLSRGRTSPRLALAICQALLVLAIAWCAFMITNALPYWPIHPALAQSPWFTFQVDISRCLWAILPAAILWGASFPLTLAAVAGPNQDPGRLVSKVYAANTVGAILGAIGFSLVVVPAVGTRGAERVLIGISAVAALLMFVSLRRRSSSPARSDAPAPMPAWGIGLAAVLIIGTAALLMQSVSPLPWGAVAYGRFMASFADRLSPGIVLEKDVPTSGSPDIFCTYVGEGLNTTIAVTKWTSGVRNFHSAGKVQASNEPRDMRLQRMLGHISALVNTNPENVLVVACGAGVTAGSFVVHPTVKRIVICDIEPLVPKYIAPMFSVENYNVVGDPRTQVVLDDGRHFIRTTREKFDVITSDPIDPWVKGCAALNTVEYYQMCKDHLKPGGVMSLWIPLYESNPDTIKSVLATFFKVFPNGILWSNDSGGEGYDAVLFGQADATKINLDELQARIDRPDHIRVKESLANVGFDSGLSLMATYAGRAADLQEWMSDAQINTDRNLRLQYLAGLSFNTYMGGAILNGITQHYKFPNNLFLGSDTLRDGLKAKLSHFDGKTASNP